MYTVKQRNEIYRKAIKRLPDSNKHFSFAYSICRAMWRTGVDENVELTEFKEAALFEPLEFVLVGRLQHWLPADDLATRETILAFCIAMTDSDQLQPEYETK